MKPENGAFAKPETFDLSIADCGSTPEFSAVEFLQKFRQTALECKSKTNNRTSEQLATVTPLLEDAQLLFEREVAHPKDLLPEPMASYEHTEKAKEAFLNSVFYLGLTALKLRDDEEPEFANSLFQKEKKTAILEQLLRDMGQNAWQLSDDKGPKGFPPTVWKSAKPEFYSPEQIASLLARYSPRKGVARKALANTPFGAEEIIERSTRIKKDEYHPIKNHEIDPDFIGKPIIKFATENLPEQEIEVFLERARKLKFDLYEEGYHSTFDIKYIDLAVLFYPEDPKGFLDAITKTMDKIILDTRRHLTVSEATAEAVRIVANKLRGQKRKLPR